MQVTARVPVRVHEQDERTYCGAAAAQIIVGALTGSLPPQADRSLERRDDAALSAA